MPERRKHQGPPDWQELEVLLQGSDRPRPLPPALRSRLEEALLTQLAAGRAALAASPPRVGQEPASRPARAAVGDDAAAGPQTGVPRSSAGVTAESAGVAAESAGVAAESAGGATDLPAGARSRLQDRLLARRRRRKWTVLAVVGAAAAAVAVAVATLTPGPTQSRLATGGHAASVAAPAVRSPRFRAQRHASKAAVAAKAAASAPVAAKVPRSSTAATAAASRASGTSRTSRTSRAASVPAVSAVRPTKGPTAGRTWVTVRGTNLGKALAVYFGDTRALRLAPVSASELRVLAPPHAPGTVAVSVANSAGRSKAAAGARYTFGTSRL